MLGPMLTEEETDAPVVNYMAIKITYDKYWLLPYDQGIVLMEALGKAEIMHTNYSKHSTLGDISESEMEVHYISQEEYRKMKTNKLLGIDPNAKPKEENES